ncbi:two-component system, sensor histidine kinase and response regulator [Marmoricola sp. URHA0025 HA25]
MVVRTPQRPAIVLGALTAALVVLHLVRPSGPLGDTTYLAVILAAPVVAALGTRSSPDRRRVLLLITTGLAASALGDVVYDLYTWSGRDPDVSLADIAYYASYVFLAAAMLAIVLSQRHDARRINTDAAVDALTVAVVTVLLLWSVAVRGIVTDTSVSMSTRLVLGGYPVLDAVLLALAIRMLSVRAHREVLGVPFAVGIGCWLASDFGYMQAWASGELLAVLDVGWMVGGLLMATSTWRRPDPTAPVDEARAVRTPLGQLGLAVLPLLVPPALLLAAAVRGRDVPATEGVVAGVVIVAITVLRVWRLLVAETELRRDLAGARDDALAASRAKSTFLATMSHEIRTPMNGVIGLNELLLTTSLDERQRQYAEGVQTAGQGLLGVINEILDFSKIESGHLELEEIDFDLVELVESVAEIVGEPAMAKGLELLAYCSPELPSGLRGDPHRIRQVLLNLAGNAVKFTAQGEVIVRVGLDDRVDDRYVVRFEVTDTGIGLAPQDRDRLFEPFSQADSSTTREYGGTGLGLSISRQLVDAMGGQLAVQSSPGAGSTFWFAVPLELSHEVPVPTSSASSSLIGLRVLVVDDNATNRTILHDQLHHWEMSVDVVDGAGPAMERLREASLAGRPYDVGLLDLCMPDVDGLDLARRIQAEPTLAGVPLVLMTSGPTVTDAEARAASISAALTKPVLMSRLRRTLERVVADRAPDEPVAVPDPTSVGSRGTVLVVDDGEVNQLVAAGLLTHLGYTPEMAGDGRQAVELLGRRSFDAILMDVQMPVMDGYDATREIRRLEGGGRRTPIIAMTATVTDGERERCLAAGMDDYLAKPIEKKVVLAMLERWVPAV